MNNKPITTLEILQIAERCHLLRQTATQASVLRFADALLKRTNTSFVTISQEFISEWHTTYANQQAEGEKVLERIIDQPNESEK